MKRSLLSTQLSAWRWFKPLFLFLLITGLQLTAAAKGQDKLLNVNVNDASLETVFKIVRQQSSYLFIFRDENLAGTNMKVSFRLKDATIEQVMDRCLEGSPLTYRIVDNTVILVKRDEKPAAQQELVKLSGVVRDAENGDPLPGVTVSVKGTRIGTTTDANGRFLLNNVTPPATLVFSYIGFSSQSIEVGARREFAIQLQRESRYMQQVVVIGYGTQKKTELTGAISTFRPNDLNARPVLGPDQLLQGRMAGVNVSSANGMPGAPMRVSVRGIGSLSASNEPLYVIDGVPIIPHDAAVTNFGAKMNPLAQLNPSDIASVDVLKDAASAAIYGSRATNGVILITTKSGRKGSGQLAVNAYAGMQDVPYLDKVEMADSKLYLEVVNEGIDNFNKQFGYLPGNSKFIPGIDNPYPGLPETDWMQEVLREKAYTKNIDLSVSGGTDKTTYYISGGFLNQQGVVIYNDLKKYTGRINLTTEPLSWLRTGVNISFGYSDNNRVPGSNLGSTVMGRSLPQRPFDRPYKPNGDYYVGGTADLVYHNPIQILKEEVANLKNYRLLGNAFAELKFTKDLTYKTSFGSDIGYTHDYIYYNQKHPYGTGNGRIIDERRLLTNLLLENTLNYSHAFGALKLDVLAGHSFQRMMVSTNGIDGNGFPAPSFDVLGAAAVINNAGTNLYGNAMESYFGRANLAWKEKYMLGMSIRTDGSSRFSPDNRYGYFPSVSAGWQVSKEPFWTMPKTDLKVRVSYGSTGNQEGVSNYAYQSLTGGGYNYDGKSGIAISGFGNNALTWEKANQLDAGLELGLLGGAVNLTVDYFRKNTTNLLYNMPIQGTSGFTSITSNIGSMLNHGLEAAVNTSFNFGALNWSSDFNISFIKNRITSLIGNSDALSVGANRALQVGQDIGSIWVYRMLGIFQDDKEVPEPLQKIGVRAGDVKYEDLNGDGNIDINDRQIVGSSNPDFYGGWNNTFRYRNFDLSVFLNYTYGQDVYASSRVTIERLGQNAVNFTKKSAENRWTGPGTSNTTPRAIYSQAYNLYNSSRWMEDGSFIRIRTVSLGYELPGSILSRAKIKRVRVYLQADNLWLFTRYSGMDPEVSSDMDPRFLGEDNLVLPQPRSFNAGVNLNF